MKLIGETKNDVLVLYASGRIDNSTSSEFGQAVMSHAIGDGVKTHVVMSLAGVDYISCTGMQVLLMLANGLAAVKGKLVLCEMQGHVLEFFRIGGFDQVLTIADTEATALRWLPQPTSEAGYGGSPDKRPQERNVRSAVAVG